MSTPSNSLKIEGLSLFVLEILNFLKDNNVTDLDQPEIGHLVHYYDTLEKNRNQVLTNDEWNSILLPCEDNALRE